MDGPESLIVNTTAKGDTRVLHLINWTGDKPEQHGLSEYYIAPVRDVHIQMRKPAGREIGGLHLLLEADLEQRDVGDAVEISLPELEAYQAIAFELR